jgi:HD-like signal output (HDOD) protein/CheY-like chemotaxis protein
MSDKTIKVLLVEDNPIDARLVQEMLAEVKDGGFGLALAEQLSTGLERLAAGGIDIVLLDLSLPDSQGLDAFAKAYAKAPQVPIILLTNLDDEALELEAVHTGAQDCLVKGQVDSNLLVRAIRFAIERKRAEEARLDAADKEEQNVQTSPPGTSTSILDQIIFVFKRGEINLPSPPQITVKFKEMVNNGASLQEIAFLLQQDAAISCKLISISNSVYYKGLSENKTLGQAVARLGLTTTRQYVDAISNRALYVTKNKKFLEFIEKLWEHSLSCAYASQIVSEVLKLELPDDAFTLGLMHDIGKLVLFQAVGELQRRKKLGTKVDTAELYNTVDTHHNKFGAALLKKWNFSSGYVQIAAYHDNLEQADPISKELLVVHFANLLVKSMGYDQTQQAEIDVEDAESTCLLRLNSRMIAQVKDQVKGRMEEMRENFA